MKRHLAPITVDPEIRAGAPVFAGTRVPVVTLLEYLADGYSLADFLDCFPTVKRRQAIRVLKLANELLIRQRGQAA